MDFKKEKIGKKKEEKCVYMRKNHCTQLGLPYGASGSSLAMGCASLTPKSSSCYQ